MAEEIDPCSVAHGAVPSAQAATATSAASSADAFLAPDRTLIAVFAGPVAAYLLRYGTDAGYRTLLVEPDPGRAVGVRLDEQAAEPGVGGVAQQERGDRRGEHRDQRAIGGEEAAAQGR